MKDKWKAIANLLEKETGIMVEPSYEGWGTGYDPVYVPLLEMWARGELEEIPPIAKVPKGVVFNALELSKRSEDYAINSVRHEIYYLLHTDLFLWRLGQREVFKFGYPPTVFLVLYSLLESLRVDDEILKSHPSSEGALKQRWEEVLKNLKDLYPHQGFAVEFAKAWLGFSGLSRELYRSFKQYLQSKSKDAYEVLMGEIFGRYRAYIEQAQRLNYIDLLLEEARGRVRKDAHKGRIMTDILKKLPENLQTVVQNSKELRAEELPEDIREKVLAHLKSLPEWMRDYIKQMSYLDMVERDIRFITNFLPKTLETDLEHKGFLLFLIKPWDLSSALEGKFKGKNYGDLSDRDKRYMKEHGLSEEEFKTYSRLLKDVRIYVDAFKRKFEKFLPKEKEGWQSSYAIGKRIDYKRIQREVPIKRGKFFMRREVPQEKKLAFKLLIDLSSSMKRENKAIDALKALLLFCETLNALNMPFSISAFSDDVFSLKSFDEDYKQVKSKLLNLPNLLGGGTNLEKAILQGSEELELFCKKNHFRGVLIAFSDGEPTRGLKGEALRSLVREVKGKFPVVGVGVGKERNYIEEYFEGTGIRISEVSQLGQVFLRVVENYLKRAWSEV